MDTEFDVSLNYCYYIAKMQISITAPTIYKIINELATFLQIRIANEGLSLK
jgi:hypothetical protein